MDLTQIIVAFLGNLPATLAAVASLIAAIAALRKITDNTNKTVTAANVISRQNVQQTKDIAEVKHTADKIATAVNGSLDARFAQVNQKIEDMLTAIMTKLDTKADK